MEEGAINNQQIDNKTEEDTVDNRHNQDERNIVVDNQQVEIEEGNFISNFIKKYYQRINCQLIASALIYISYILLTVGGITLLIFHKKSIKDYTEPEDQCSGYSESDTKAYLNCYYENFQCKLYNCSVDQCLESKLSILSCVPSKFDTYTTVSGKFMFGFGLILTCVFGALIIVSLLMCHMSRRYITAQDFIYFMFTGRFSSINSN